jgi:signal transduction histidine kinase
MLERYRKWLSRLPGATDPDDLRPENVMQFIAIIYGLALLSMVRAGAVAGERNQVVFSIIVAVILFIGAYLAHQTHEYNFRFAWYGMIITLIAGISIDALGFPGNPSRYYYAVPIIMASFMAFQSSLFIAAGLSVVSYLAVALSLGVSFSDIDYLIGPFVVIAIVTMATWFTTQHLNRELRRTRDSGVQIRDMLEQLRLQRVELDRNIKTLELANVRIERMNVELDVARKAAEDADRIKTEFLAHMSHELRTPLNAILNFTAFVSDGLMGDVNDEQIDTLQKVIDSGNHLLSLINDVLDISKIEAGMMNLFIEDVDINSVLRGTISTTKGLVKNKPLELIARIEDDLPHIAGDKRRIRQVFLNLVSNAVKFTPEGSIIIEANRRDGDIHIAVRDTGIGIAPEDQADVFVAFKQAQHDLETLAGTGLGLPICKHFVEAHGGRLWFESEKGVGSTFYVELPIQHLEAKEDVEPTIQLEMAEPTKYAAPARPPKPLEPVEDFQPVAVFEVAEQVNVVEFTGVVESPKTVKAPLFKTKFRSTL